MLITFLKETATQLFSCENCEIFKSTRFEKLLRTAASAIDGEVLTFANLRQAASRI